MRAVALFVIVLVALPAVGALGAPRVVRPQDTPLLPKDLSDGDLLRLLAPHVGAHPKPVKLVIPAGSTVRSLVTKLAARGHLPLDPRDAQRFASLDARVAAPTLALLAAVDQAWAMRDEAFSKLTPAEQRELALSDPHQWTDRQTALMTMVNEEEMIAAAILVLDTIDAIVTPGVRDAVAAGAWPATATADPVGVLRLGSPGNDIETLDRIVQIDPSGDDVYRNNAGGAMDPVDSAGGQDVSTRSIGVSVSLDFGGNDTYNSTRRAVIGSAREAIGILEDFAGDDNYRCKFECVGDAIGGIGLFRDVAGNDSYAGTRTSFGDGLGASLSGLGIVREDAGNDDYYVSGGAGGFAASNAHALGLLWDRAGADAHRVIDSLGFDNFGYAVTKGNGWFVDEGSSADSYGTTGVVRDPHGCDHCEWLLTDDVTSPNRAFGRGNDDFGGLAYVLSEDNVPLTR